MKLSAVGPMSSNEALDSERTDPPVQKDSVAQTETTQLETESQNPSQRAVPQLTLLIEEAKKRADQRRRKGLKLRMANALESYKKVESFEEMQMEKGVKLDESS